MVTKNSHDEKDAPGSRKKTTTTARHSQKADFAEALIFIDTNIFLDFYRVLGSGGALSLLNHIDQNHGRIITSNQVEMEYKKNRQRVVLESLGRLKSPEWGKLTPPAFLAEAQPAKVIAKHRRGINSQQSKLKRRIEAILRNPGDYDPVYKVVQRLFKHEGAYNLTRKKKIRSEIRHLATKRFSLGYPPRKDKDTSMGDAVNWEWIIQCASETRKNIIIVSRDSDYGITYGKEVILNDWLAQEFKARISRKRKILLTNRLAQAFKMASIAVSRTEEEQERHTLALKVVKEVDKALTGFFLSLLPESLLRPPPTLGDLFRELVEQRSSEAGEIANELPFKEPPKERT